MRKTRLSGVLSYTTLSVLMTVVTSCQGIETVRPGMTRASVAIPAPPRVASDKAGENRVAAPGDADSQPFEPRPSISDLQPLSAEASRRLNEMAAYGGSEFWSVRGRWNADLRFQSEKRTLREPVWVESDGTTRSYGTPRVLVMYLDFDNTVTTSVEKALSFGLDAVDDFRLQKHVLAVGIPSDEDTESGRKFYWYWSAGIEWQNQRRTDYYPSTTDNRTWPEPYYDASRYKMRRILRKLPLMSADATRSDGTPFSSSERTRYERLRETYGQVTYMAQPFELYDGLNEDLVRLTSALQSNYLVEGNTVSDEVCKWIWGKTQKATRIRFGPAGVSKFKDFFGENLLQQGEIFGSDNIFTGSYEDTEIEGVACEVPTARPVFRATKEEFAAAVESGELDVPPHLPFRTLVDLKYQGSGGDAAFQELGENGFSYTVPDGRTLVLNYFEKSINVNGVRLRPRADDAYKGANFVFGPGERVVFRLGASAQVAGFTVNSSLVDAAVTAK